MSTVSSNDIQLVDAASFEGCNHLVCIETASAAAEDRATFLLNAFDVFRSQLNPVVFFFVEATIAPSDAPDFLCSVFERQAFDERLDDCVQAWTEATASDDCSFDLLRLENYLLISACAQKLVA